MLREALPLLFLLALAGLALARPLPSPERGDDPTLQQIIDAAQKDVQPAAAQAFVWVNGMLFLHRATWASFLARVPASDVVRGSPTNETVSLQDLTFAVTTAFIEHSGDYQAFGKPVVFAYRYLISSKTNIRLRFLPHMLQAVRMLDDQIKKDAVHGDACEGVPSVAGEFSALSARLQPLERPHIEQFYSYTELYRLWDVVNAHCLYRPPNFCEGAGPQFFQASYFALRHTPLAATFFDFVNYFEFYLASYDLNNGTLCACGDSEHFPCAATLAATEKAFNDALAQWQEVTSVFSVQTHDIPAGLDLFSGAPLSDDELGTLVASLRQEKQSPAAFSIPATAAYHLFKHYHEIPSCVVETQCRGMAAVQCYQTLAERVVATGSVHTNLDQFGARSLVFSQTWSCDTNFGGLVALRLLEASDSAQFTSSMETFIPSISQGP